MSLNFVFVNLNINRKIEKTEKKRNNKENTCAITTHDKSN